jgi:hypothetical protein
MYFIEFCFYVFHRGIGMLIFIDDVYIVHISCVLYYFVAFYSVFYKLLLKTL